MSPLMAALRVRRRLYFATFVVAALVAVIERSTASVVVATVALAGAGVGWVPFRNRHRRVLTLFGYEIAVGLIVTTLGQPLIGLLIIAASAGATALMGSERYAVPILAGVAGSAVALITSTTLGAGTNPSFGFGTSQVGVAIGVVFTGGLLAGITQLFTRMGAEVDARQRQLAEWPRRQKQLMDAAPEPMMVHRDGEILYANPASARLVGVDQPEALLGQDLLEFVHPEERHLVRQRMQRLMAGEAMEPVTVRAITRAGEVRYVESRGYRTDWQGQLAAQLVMRDRTEVEESRAELHAFFERLPVALYRSLPSGEVISANPALAGLLGYEDVNEMLADQSVAARAYPDKTRRRHWRELIEQTGRVIGFEQEMRRPDGTRIRVSDSAVVVRDDQGRVRFYEGALVDVTDRWVAERSRRRLVSIVEATSDLVGLADASGRLRYANPAFRSFLGIDPEGALPSVHVRHHLAGDDEQVAAEVTGAVRSRGRWEGELTLVGAGGAKAEVSAVVQRHAGDEGQHFYSIVARDVTESRRTAARLEKLVKAKDEFVASVSHELRTPLTAVVGMASELRDGYVQFADSERRDLVGLIAEQAQEVADIVEDLLVAARAETDSIVLVEEVVDLEEAVAAVVRGLPEPVRDRIEVKVGGTVRGDGRRIRQILRNLLTNAVRYGGDRIQVRQTGAGDPVNLEVADDGDGVPAELWDQIFEPFERAHTVGTQPNSVGLGLTVSRWLARRMGGDLTYRHDLESVFTLTLPGRLEGECED